MVSDERFISPPKRTVFDVNVGVVLSSIILSRIAFDICSWNSSSAV